MAVKTVIAVILGGGAGTRLFPLTVMRAKPAVPVGGNYRLVDIPVSNCINSELLRIFILTQYNSASLNRHIARTYRFGRFVNGFVEVLAAEITPQRADWFQGTADAVRQSFDHFEDHKCHTVLVLSGDHLYRMDYRKMLAWHALHSADITVSLTAVTREDASSFGLVRVDSNGRVLEFREKPRGADLEAMRTDTTVLGLSPEQAERRPFLASMGIYAFDRDRLRGLLFQDFPEALDFGKDLLPAALGLVKVTGYLFDGYWEDIGTIATFYRANLALTLPEPPFNFYDAEAPIYTRPRFLPGTKLVDCEIRDSIFAEGSTLERARVRDSIIGIRSRISSGVQLEGVLMMGADYYETVDELAAARQKGVPPIGIGRNTVIRRAIVDKNARIGANVRILNATGEMTRDHAGCHVRDGIVIVPKNAVLPDGTVV